MALIVGTNTWATVAEADGYLTLNMSAEEWFALPVTSSPGKTSRESVMVTAFNEIASSSLVSVDKSSTDINVKNAQCEMALFLVKYYDEVYGRRAAIASGLSSFDYSERSEQFNSRDGGGSPVLPGNVLGMLIDYSDQNTTVEIQA